MYDVLDVCRYVINYSNDMEYGISNLKLQKILYFIQAYFLTTLQKECFKEKIEAWSFGPVVPEAYRAYKQFGSGSIPKIFYVIEENPSNIWNSKVVRYDDEIISNSDKKRMELVVDKFADFSAADLVRLTHRQKPWIDAYIPHMNNEITSKAIKDYFNG